MMVKSEFSKKRANTLNWKFRLFIMIVYFLSIFLVEPFFRDDLMKKSIEIIELIQDFMGPDLLEVAAWLSLLGSNLVFSIIFIITFSFTNIFKSYLLVMIICCCNFLVSTINLFYGDGRPFYISNNRIIPYTCKMSYGNPSANFLRSTAFYLSLWNIFIQSKTLRDKYLIKGFLLFIVVFINIIIFLSDIAIGTQSVNQEIFGGLLGFGMYLTLFWLIDIYTNDSKTLLSIIKIKIFNYLMINFVFSLITLSSIYFNEHIDNEQRNSWIDRIKNKCGYVHENVLFENEDYLMLATVFSNIFAFIGLKNEFVYTFRSNINKWTKYNFSLEVKEVDSLFSSMDFTKDTQWNHNTFLISFLS